MVGKPNIILITSDQLRPYELGCYGGKEIATPNIDRLAARGTVWETAISNFPVCMPARSIMMSGQMNRTATGGKTNVSHGGRPGDFTMPEYPYPGRPHLKDPALPELLRGAGYHTAAIGKWHIHSWPDDIGFDSYLIPRVHHAHSAQTYTRNGGPEFCAPGYSVDLEAGEAETFLIDNARSEKPFFLYYNISPPHCPVADVPEEFLRLYDPDKLTLRENTDEAAIEDKDYWYKVYRWDFRYYSHRLPHTMELPEGYDLRALAAEYFGAVTWMDRAVGRILNAVAAAGLEEDTLVVFTADHGENLGSHGLVQKGTENDESICIPLVMAGPDVARGHRVAGSVASLVDLAPSFLAAAGQGAPEHMHGASLMAEAGGGAADGRVAFFETGNGAGLRSPDTTIYARFTAPRQLAEPPATLFDNVNDPYQYQNLASEQPTHPLMAELARRDAKLSWSDLEDDPQ